jgi:hypothetical protein
MKKRRESERERYRGEALVDGLVRQFQAWKLCNTWVVLTGLSAQGKNSINV